MNARLVRIAPTTITLLFGCWGSSSPPPAPPPTVAAEPQQALEGRVLDPESVLFAEASRDDQNITILYTRPNSKEKYFHRFWVGTKAFPALEAEGKFRLLDTKSPRSIEVPCKFVDTATLGVVNLSPFDLKQLPRITFVGVTQNENKLLIAGVDFRNDRMEYISTLDADKFKRIEASKKVLIAVNDRDHPEVDGRIVGEFACAVAKHWDELQLYRLGMK